MFLSKKCAHAHHNRRLYMAIEPSPICRYAAPYCKDMKKTDRLSKSYARGSIAQNFKPITPDHLKPLVVYTRGTSWHMHGHMQVGAAAWWIRVYRDSGRRARRAEMLEMETSHMKSSLRWCQRESPKVANEKTHSPKSSSYAFVSALLPTSRVATRLTFVFAALLFLPPFSAAFSSFIFSLLRVVRPLAIFLI